MMENLCSHIEGRSLFPAFGQWAGINYYYLLIINVLVGRLLAFRLKSLIHWQILVYNQEVLFHAADTKKWAVQRVVVWGRLTVIYDLNLLFGAGEIG